MKKTVKLVPIAEIQAELGRADAQAFVSVFPCQCGGDHFRSKLVHGHTANTELIGKELHRAAWRTLNPDLGAVRQLVVVTFAAAEGITSDHDGNAVVSMTGDVDSIAPEELIRVLEEFVMRMRMKHGDPQPEPGGYL